MRLRGFCFSNPYFREKEDLFEDLINTDPSAIYNPWPQLAHGNFIDEAAVQPIIRSFYVPMHLNDFLDSVETPLFKAKTGLQCMIDHLTFSHELIHLELSFTPAKEWVRFCLSAAYENLLPIINSDEWDGKLASAYHRLVFWNDRISESARRITLAEELIATAFSFNAVWKTIVNDPNLPDTVKTDLLDCLNSLEALWVASQGEQLPEFTDLYDGFRIAAYLSNFGGVPPQILLARIGVF